MTRGQIARRIRTVLRARKWGGTGSPVFARGSVVCTSGAVMDAIVQFPMPVAMIRVLDAEMDPSHKQDSGLLRTGIAVTVVVSVPGDRVGEAALLGANRPALDASGGAGLLDVEEEVLAAIAELNGSGQVSIQHLFSSAAEVDAVSETRYCDYCEYRFSAFTTAARTYDEPQNLAGVIASPDVALAWDAPRTTDGLVSYVLRRVSGNQPVAYPGDGTDVPLASPLDLAVVDSPGPGTWAYSIFAGYDDLDGATALEHSDCGQLIVTVP